MAATIVPKNQETPWRHAPAHSPSRTQQNTLAHEAA